MRPFLLPRLLAALAGLASFWTAAPASAQVEALRPEPYVPPLTPPAPVRELRRPQLWVAPREAPVPSAPPRAVPVRPSALRTPEPLIATPEPHVPAAALPPGVLVWPPPARSPAPAPAAPTGANVTYNLMVVGQNGQPMALKLNELQLQLGAGQAIAYPPAPGAPQPPPAGYPVAAPEARPVVPFERRRQAGLELAGAFVAESYPAGGVDLTPGFVARPGLAAHYDLDEKYYLDGAFNYHEYTLADQQFPTSRHRRDEFWLTSAVGMYLPQQGALRVGGELGYHLRQVSNGNTLPPPLTTPYVTSGSHLFHGPRLGGRLEYMIDPSLRFDLSAQVMPYLLASGDAAVAATAPAFGYGLTAGVSWHVWRFVFLEGGYRFEGQSGAGSYTMTKHGPVLGLAGRF